VERPHPISLFIQDGSARLFVGLLLFNLALVKLGLSVHSDAPTARHKHIVNKCTAIHKNFLGVGVNWWFVEGVIVIPVCTQNVDECFKASIILKPFCKLYK
jgi:hypothetical protein